jgi:hypothetical protein
VALDLETLFSRGKDLARQKKYHTNMIYITQLIYLKPDQASVFDEFEAVAIPLISLHKGQLLFRLRPSSSSDFIETSMEAPYEIHLVSFESEANFSDFMLDEKRKQFLHLKEQSIRSTLLFKGVQL